MGGVDDKKEFGTVRQQNCAPASSGAVVTDLEVCGSEQWSVDLNFKSDRRSVRTTQAVSIMTFVEHSHEPNWLTTSSKGVEQYD